MKQRLCDKFYDWIEQAMREDASRREYTKAWVITWHLREDWGWSTAKINYELNKLVKEGKMLKWVGSSRVCTKFRPIAIDGFYFKDDKFYHNKIENE